MKSPRPALGVSIGLVLLLGAVVVWLARGPGTGAAATETVGADGVREVVVRAHAWGFSPRVVRTEPGQRVRFLVSSEDIQHGFAINELGLNLQLRPGQAVRSPTVSMALPEGTYAIHCSAFCGLGHPSMKARLVVGAPRPEPGSLLPWLASAAALAAAAAFLAAARSARA
jgi:heme/copper-type cytochrome/quinol oxidase subunit 2